MTERYDAYIDYADDDADTGRAQTLTSYRRFVAATFEGDGDRKLRSQARHSRRHHSGFGGVHRRKLRIA